MRDDYGYRREMDYGYSPGYVPHPKVPSMTLWVTHHDDTSTVFHCIAVDSTKLVDGVLEFESDDTTSKCQLYFVPDVKYWVTYYR